MKIVLPGGTGQVGHLLARVFLHDQHEVVALSTTRSESGAMRVIPWDAKTVGYWVNELDGADVVINLAGRSVNCRYTPAHRAAILESRVDSTRAIGAALLECRRPPRVWLQASTATIYAHRYDAANDEDTGLIGGDEPGVPESWRFSVEVAQAWENAVAECGELPHTRTVLLRSAMTMSHDEGGIFDTLLNLVRHGLGGPAGDGQQYVSWIHEADFVRAIYWLIDHEHLSGPINLASPGPLPNADFMQALRQAWGIRVGLPAKNWMLELGARFMHTETELVLKSRCVVPGRLLEDGFEFQYPDWPAAARELCKHWRLDHRKGGKVRRAR